MLTGKFTRRRHHIRTKELPCGIACPRPLPQHGTTLDDDADEAMRVTGRECSYEPEAVTHKFTYRRWI
jgi:hypothetical protein